MCCSHAELGQPAHGRDGFRGAAFSNLGNLLHRLLGQQSKGECNSFLATGQCEFGDGLVVQLSFFIKLPDRGEFDVCFRSVDIFFFNPLQHFLLNLFSGSIVEIALFQQLFQKRTRDETCDTPDGPHGQVGSEHQWFV